jgi:1-acyl-sn-glycerol-3-phosphate acyltransferase
MIKAKHHWFIYPFFIFYSFWKIKRHFKDVHINTLLPTDTIDKPILLIGNHISWWDGFIVQYINQKLWKKKFHFMMLEEQLVKHRFLNLTGGFSIAKKSKEIIASLRYANELLQDKTNLVLMFPQGKITSMHQQTMVFEKGIERILQHTSETIELVFMVNLIDYFSYATPSLSIYITNYQGDKSNHKDIEKAFQDFYTSCVDKQKKLASE